MFLRALVLSAAAALVACAPRPSPPTEATPMRMKTPYPEIEWKRGPALLPREALVAWLDQQGAATLVRLPVVVRFREGGIGIAGGRAGELELLLSDSALGRSLHDHARSASPDRTPVLLHLSGHWRGMSGDTGTLDLRRVERDVPPGVDYAEVDPGA